MTSLNSTLPSDILIPLYNFTSRASSSLNIQTVMTHFFNILSQEVSFDIGVYLVVDDDQLEGRAYVRPWIKRAEGTKFANSLLANSKETFGSLNSDSLGSIDCSVLQGHGKQNGATGESVEYEKDQITEIPLKCWNRTCGIIAFASSTDNSTEKSGALIEKMAEHLERVIERLFTSQDIERKKLSNILCSMTEGVYLFDVKGQFISSINPKGMDLISKLCEHNSECISKELTTDGMLSLHSCDCPFASFLDKVRNMTDTEKAGTFTDEIQSSSGMTLSLTVSSLSQDDGWQHGHVITAKDITEERMLQRKMILSSKLASLGEMAAGIAHEINNPLQSILLNIEMLGTILDAPGTKRLERVHEGVSRIRAIVKDLLIFAREDTTDTQNVDLNIVIEKGADIMRHQLKLANVNVRLDLEKRPLIVSCNRNLFQQVIINLFQNAKDAIEESKTGSTVSIRSRLSEENMVIVEVTDDGPGIPDEFMNKVFEPFLTTKELGKGTGLGLSVSRKIIEGMGGTLTVDSKPGSHTTFRISIAHKSAVINERRSQRYREPEYGRLANLSVLMVDDEQEVLHSVCEAISSHVGSLETSNDGAKALERIIERDYDIILLDIRMPGLNGTELYHKIAELKPALANNVLFLSGDIEGEDTAEFLRQNQCKYLPKPFSSKELIMTMCEIATQPKKRLQTKVTPKEQV